MSGTAALDSAEGRPSGGPFAFGGRLLLPLMLAGCAGAPPPAPSPEAALSRPLATYREAGMMAGPADFPAVVGTGMVAGPADSAFVLVGLSLPNSALWFERDGASFVAEYTVDLVIEADTGVVRRVSRRELVRVSGFTETARTDESVVFQEAVLLGPGRYRLTIEAGRAAEPPILAATDTLDVPSFRSGERLLGGPLILYEGLGRRERAEPPAVILNPRNTVSYGGERPILYVERYDPGPVDTMIVRVRDETEVLVHEFEMRMPGGQSPVRWATLPLPAEDLPLGRLWVEVEGGGGRVTPRVPLIVSISDQWIVANFDDVLSLLRYIATVREIEELRASDARERRDLWEAFWTRRDPVPATAINEFRNEFFERIRFVTDRFAETGLPGWRTHRGEVYIVLGPPQVVQDRYLDRAQTANGLEWRYENLDGGPLTLLFIDRTGFGRYVLSPASEAAFRSRAERLKPGSD